MSEPKGITRRTALGLLVTGAVAGCGIEPDGQIRPGLDLDAPVDNTGTVIPPPPAPGATPEQIIRGFLNAGDTAGEHLTVTKSYLTDACANKWLPDTQTVIYGSEEPTIRRLWGKPDTYRVSIRVVARINADGRYLVAPPNDGATFDFRVTTVDGEWRIDWMQDGFGRVLSSAAVARTYRAHEVFYCVIASNVLVPDQRWIPNDQEATRLVRFQLGNVPDYLENAVASASTAQLAIESVPVKQGVAQVNLAEHGVPSDATTRKQLAAQLVATLRRVGVSEVAISVDGAPMTFDDVDGALTSPEQFDYEYMEPAQHTVYARDGRQLIEVDTLDSITKKVLGSRGSPFPEIDTRWRPLGLRADGKELAGTVTEDDELVRWPKDGQAVHVPRFAANLTRPCYDVEGWLWVGGAGLGRQSGHRLFAINSNTDPEDTTKSAPQQVPATWLGTRNVVAAVVSPEGGRVAVISEEIPGAGSELHVAGVVREPNGLPTETSPSAVRVAANLVEMLDAVWVGETTLAVIGRTDDQRKMRAYLADVNGEVVKVGRPGNMAAVTTTGGDHDLVLTSPEGRVWRRVGGGWSQMKQISGVVVSGV